MVLNGNLTIQAFEKLKSVTVHCKFLSCCSSLSRCLHSRRLWVETFHQDKTMEGFDHHFALNACVEKRETPFWPVNLKESSPLTIQHVKRRLFQDDDEEVTSVGLDFQSIHIHQDNEELDEGMASSLVDPEEEDTQGCTQLDTSSSLSGLDDQIATPKANEPTPESVAVTVNPSEDGRKTRRSRPRRRIPAVQTIDGDIFIRKRSRPPSSKLYLSSSGTAADRDPSPSTDFFTSQSKARLKRKRTGYYSSTTCAAVVDLSVVSQSSADHEDQLQPTNAEAVDLSSSDEDVHRKGMRDGRPPKRQKTSTSNDAMYSQSSQTVSNDAISEQSTTTGFKRKRDCNEPSTQHKIQQESVDLVTTMESITIPMTDAAFPRKILFRGRKPSPINRPII